MMPRIRSALTLAALALGMALPVRADQLAPQDLNGTQETEATLTCEENDLMFQETVPSRFECSDPADDTLLVGNGIAFDEKVVANCTDVSGQHLNYTAATNAFSCGTSTSGAPAAHNLLSASHGDTSAAAAVRGYLVRGNATPAWERFACVTDGIVPMGDGTDVACEAIDLGTDTVGNYALGTGEGGDVAADRVLETSLKAVDAAVDEECLTYETTTGDFEWQTCAAGANHDMLSATHTDSAAAAVTRGAIMVGNSTPAWARVTVGATRTVPMSDGTDTAFEVIDLGTDTTGSYAAGTAEAGDVAADKVLESSLKAVDAAADEECLTYESTTGDFEWRPCVNTAEPVVYPLCQPSGSSSSSVTFTLCYFTWPGTGSMTGTLTHEVYGNAFRVSGSGNCAFRLIDDTAAATICTSATTTSATTTTLLDCGTMTGTPATRAAMRIDIVVSGVAVCGTLYGGYWNVTGGQ